MTPKTYGLIELAELGLIKSAKGKPVKNLGTVRKIVLRCGMGMTGKTPHGQPCYEISQADIKKINNRFK